MRIYQVQPDNCGCYLYSSTPQKKTTTPLKKKQKKTIIIILTMTKSCSLIILMQKKINMKIVQLIHNCFGKVPGHTDM